MKLELNKQNLAVILALLLLFSASTFFALALIPKKNISNVFDCKGQKFSFRAKVPSCLEIKVTPGDEILTETLTNPSVNTVALLVDPNETGGTALSMNQIYSLYKSLWHLTGISAGVAYTKHWPEQPMIENITIEQATFNHPIIWIRQNQSKTEVIADGPRVYANAKTQADLDAATCRVAIDIAKRVLGC